MSRKVVLWTEHFNFRILVLMFDLELYNRTYIFRERERERARERVEWLIKKRDYENRAPGAAGGGEKTAVPAISVGTLRGGRKGDPRH